MAEALTSGQAAYMFSNARPAQVERLRSLSSAFDGATIRALEDRGVAAGWRCLEVGGGNGSIAAWLCGRVAPGGTVLATDLDTTILGELEYPNLDVRVHDVLADELPADEFDLVHVRLVLGWLGTPRTALQRMFAALKPGGWLLAEEADLQTLAPDPGLDPEVGALFSRGVAAIKERLAAGGAFDPYYGRRLLTDMEWAGLVGVECEGRAAMCRGGQPMATVQRLTVLQLRDAISARGRLTLAEIDRFMALYETPELRFLGPMTMSAWGRRPASA